MNTMTSQLTSLTSVYSAVYSGADQRTDQSLASLAFVGDSSVTGEFPAQRASNMGNVSLWWRHHEGNSLLEFSLAIKTRRNVAVYYESVQTISPQQI